MSSGRVMPLLSLKIDEVRNPLEYCMRRALMLHTWETRRIYGTSGPFPTLPLSARSHHSLPARSEGWKNGHRDLNAEAISPDTHLHTPTPPHAHVSQGRPVNGD